VGIGLTPRGRSFVDRLPGEVLVPGVETAHVGVGDAHRACGKRGRDHNALYIREFAIHGCSLSKRKRDTRAQVLIHAMKVTGHLMCETKKKTKTRRIPDRNHIGTQYRGPHKRH